MSRSLKVAAIQMNSGPDFQHNMDTVRRLVREAATKNATFIVLPEVFHFRGPREQLAENAQSIPGAATTPLIELAKEYNTFILAGSVCEKIASSSKVYNSSILIDSTGHISAQYRKLHLFDADVDSSQIRESDMYVAGEHPVIGDVAGIKVGLSICYDLRFPELYRYYANHSARILSVPSSFTTPTGKAHWESLLRARAIENHAYVIAPNQTGVGAGNVPTYGNSMIIDPWGRILSRGSESDEEIIYAELDFDFQDTLRRQLPSLDHQRKDVGI